MNIGVHELEITPPFKMPLAGFGKARTADFTGVHDPLHVGCAIFEASGEVVALLSCEVIGLKSEVIKQLREALSALADFPAERVVVVCTHTHGAPVIQGDFIPFLIERLVHVVKHAWEERTPRRLLVARSSHSEWVGFNRRHLETGFLPVDREVLSLGVIDPDGSIRAVLYHYACHPSILGPNNLLVTADWPGYMRQHLHQALGRKIPVLYLKGTEGDINTGYSAGVSSLGVSIPTRTYAMAERVGKIIGETLLRSWKEAREMPDVLVRFQSQILELPYQSTKGLAEAQRQVAWWEEEVARMRQTKRPAGHVLAAKVEQAYARFRLAALEEIAAAGNRTKMVEQVAFRLGDAGFLSFPGEFFVETGLRVKQEAAATFSFPLGITNDYLGYFPPAKEFAQGGYEVACARFQDTVEEQWTGAGVNLLNGLF